MSLAVPAGLLPGISVDDQSDVPNAIAEGIPSSISAGLLQKLFFLTFSVETLKNFFRNSFGNSWRSFARSCSRTFCNNLFPKLSQRVPAEMVREILLRDILEISLAVSSKIF